MSIIFDVIVSAFIIAVYGKTEILIGQNYQAEFESYVSAAGQPAGASFYTTFKTPSAFQGMLFIFNVYMLANIQ